MCLALFQPAGKEIDKSHLTEGWRNNPDGGGFMYFDHEWRLQSFKTKDLNEFIARYEKAWDTYGMKSPFAVHFRWATHGSNSIENVHPFAIDSDTMMIHNGIIPCHIPNMKMSDTASFAANYLANLPVRWYDNKYLFDMVQQYCAGSKLVIMTQDVDAEYCAYIVNEKDGHWQDEIWYSNTSYCSPKQRSFFTPKSVSKYTDEEMDIPALAKCELCGEPAVFDDVCYECETCQQCYEDDSACVCSGQLSFHNMTDHQYYSFESVV